MVRIITIPNDNDSGMNSLRERIVPWARTHGWVYTGYNKESDHPVQIGRAGGGAALEALDFECHGNPACFDDTDINTARSFGRRLSQSPGFSGRTAVYLDACNTGLTGPYGGPIAQAVADGARCTVYGTKGYMSGTFAEGDECCYATIDELPPYPGAQDASGRDVWTAFRPRGIVVDEAHKEAGVMNAPISLTIKSEPHLVGGLGEELDAIMRTSPVEFPNLRMAADLTINYLSNREVIILDLYANGGLVRDRVSGKTWRVQNPDRLHTLVRDRLR